MEQKHLGKLFLKKFKETNRPTSISWITMYNRMILYNKKNKGIEVPDDIDSENEDVVESIRESSMTKQRPSRATKEPTIPASATNKRKTTKQQSKPVTKKRHYKTRGKKKEAELEQNNNKFDELFPATEHTMTAMERLTAKPKNYKELELGNFFLLSARNAIVVAME